MNILKNIGIIVVGIVCVPFVLVTALISAIYRMISGNDIYDDEMP